LVDSSRCFSFQRFAGFFTFIGLLHLRSNGFGCILILIFCESFFSDAFGQKKFSTRISLSRFREQKKPGRLWIQIFAAAAETGLNGDSFLFFEVGRAWALARLFHLYVIKPKPES
jgi:hypothetical protein